MADAPTRKPVYAVAVWGVLGFAAIVFRAIWSLTPMALAPIRAGTMTALQWFLYVGWLVFMVYSEGYKGFQRKVAPRVAARAMYAAYNPRPLLVIFAPLFCMGFFHATRKRMIVSWCVFTGIVLMVMAVRHLDQPWRGIVDGGVVAGLGWGLVALLWSFARALQGHPMPVPADVPGEAHPAIDPRADVPGRG